MVNFIYLFICLFIYLFIYCYSEEEEEDSEGESGMDWDELEEEARRDGNGFIWPICCVLFGLCSFIAEKGPCGLC